MNNTPKKIDKVSFKVYARAFEFCIDYDHDPNNLEFYENGESVDVFVRRE